MKILDRYVGQSVFITALFGVVVLSLVLVVGKIFKELLDLLINHDVPLDMVLAFIAFVLPFSLTFTIPWGFLTAVLLVFGRMSAENELIALKANGVSIPRISVPIFVLAGVLTALCFWINIEVAPMAQKRITEAMFEMATNNPGAFFRSGEVVDNFPDRRVYVGGKEGEKLKNIIVFEINEENEPIQMMFAKEGELAPDPANARLLLQLKNARLEQRDKKEPRDVTKIRQGIVMNEAVFPISLEEFYKKELTARSLNSYTLNELITYIREGAGGRLTEALVELNKRFSVSLACAAFALIAIPLGITAHRKETSVGFAISLVLAFTYFFFIIMANTFQNKPSMYPSVLIWVPNFLFMGLGGYLFWKLSKR